MLSKIQMENTKRYHYSIFAKITPYFNENEFVVYLTELGAGKDSSWLSIIRWKEQKYNIILSNGIAEYINKLKMISIFLQIKLNLIYLKMER